jgi:hypothetical protein
MRWIAAFLAIGVLMARPSHAQMDAVETLDAFAFTVEVADLCHLPIDMKKSGKRAAEIGRAAIAEMVANAGPNTQPGDPNLGAIHAQHIEDSVSAAIRAVHEGGCDSPAVKARFHPELLDSR